MLVAGLAFIVFWLSPVRQMADSNGSMLLSESLLHHRSFVLDGYFAGRGVPEQFEVQDGHIYYWYPPGTSILSLPLVAGLGALGVSAAGPGGTFDEAGESRLEGLVASLVAAAFIGVAYATARLALPTKPSLLIACASALGTQIWSTASRATWNHGWQVLLLGFAVHRLLAHAEGRRAVGPVALGFVAGALFVVRPTGVVPAAGLAIHLLGHGWRALARYAAAASLVVGGLVAYSLVEFGYPLPGYYRLSHSFAAARPLAGLLGTLFSPSRGLLIYVPVLGYLAFVLLRHHARLRHRPLVTLALGCIAVHVGLVSMWPDWWGGNSYGPRLTTCLVPWFVLLAILLDCRPAATPPPAAGAWRRPPEGPCLP